METPDWLRELQETGKTAPITKKDVDELMENSGTTPHTQEELDKAYKDDLEKYSNNEEDSNNRTGKR